MPKYAVTGPDFKRLINLADTAPVAFAFRPGKTQANHALLLHRKLPASALLREAKKDDKSAKVGFGMARLDGNVIEFRCEKPLAGMEKKVREYLVLNKSALKIRILDSEGVAVPGENQGEAEDQSETAAPPDPAPEQTAPEQTAPPPQDAGQPADPAPAAVADDPADIVAGLKRLQPAIAAAPAPVAAKLKGAMTGIVGLIKAGDIAKARAQMGKLEAAAEKLGAAKQPKASPGADQPDNGDRLRNLAARAKALQPAIESAPAPSAAKLQTAFQTAIANMKAGELAAADSAIGRLEKALSRLSGMAADPAPAEKPAPAQAAETRPDRDNAAASLRTRIEAARQRAHTETSGDLRAALDARFDDALAQLNQGDISAAQPALDFAAEAMRLQSSVDALMPDYTRAMATGMVADPQQLRMQFQSAVDLVAGPDHARAWEHLRNAQDAIVEGASANSSAFLADIPEDARPFARSRLDWAAVRTRLFGEIDRLQTAIADACGNDPDTAEIKHNVGRLKAPMEKLDLRLADTLDKIANAEPGPTRDAKKADARLVLREYQSVLQTPFFREIDEGNGFTTVSVTSSALEALRKIDAVLAG